VVTRASSTRRRNRKACEFSLGVLLVTFVAMFGPACKPNLDDTVSLVSAPQILAVRVGSAGGVAEAAPMGTLEFSALYVDGSGPITPSTVNWAICNERKPLAELEPVSPLCLYASGAWFTALGVGNPVTGTMPSDACRQFGPDVPEPMAGQPPGRPVDPDVTGGYYQPVRALAPGVGSDIAVVAETRLQCGLAQASPDVVAAFSQRYHPNTNPLVAALGLCEPSVPPCTKGVTPWAAAGPGVTPNAVAAGQHVYLHVAWASCPLTDVPNDQVCGPDETGAACTSCGPGVAVSTADCCPGPTMDCTHPLGCTGAERYVVFDTQSGGLVDQREGIAVSWFATGGAFDSDATGRAGTDFQVTSDNGWQTPAASGPVTVWVVLRDDRGGVGWQTYPLDVR
jgi:hypothetical protein